MEYFDALRTAADRSGQNMAGIARYIGRSDSYVRVAISNGVDPLTSNAAAMLEACGYSLYAAPKDAPMPDSALLIEPITKD